MRVNYHLGFSLFLVVLYSVVEVSGMLWDSFRDSFGGGEGRGGGLPTDCWRPAGFQGRGKGFIFIFALISWEFFCVCVCVCFGNMQMRGG